MKATIHPKYNPAAQVICVCGNRFTIGSTQDVIHVELCFNCHPFYTGEQKFVDTASKIQKFLDKKQKAHEHIAIKKKKIEEKKKADTAPKTLREMLMGTR